MNNLNKQWTTEILFNKEQIEEKIKEIAFWVNKEYANSQDLILIGLLKGCIPFLAELMKHIEVPHILDFMIASSYKGGQTSSNNIKIIMDLEQDISNKDVLIVEDIVDSGITLQKIVETLSTRKPRSLKVVTLLDKPEGRKTGFKVDHFGFIAPNKFLVGFGLDVKEKLRNLPYIGVFDKTKFDEC